MVFNCSICSESLEKGPGENPAENLVAVARHANKSNLAALVCGHIFHSFCINKWMTGGMATSGKCPCCRKTIGPNKCIPIFPDSYDDSLSHDDIQANLPGPVLNAPNVTPCNHHVEINTLQTQTRALEGELEQINRLYELQGEDFQELNNKFQTERQVSQNYAMKYKQYESYKDLYEKGMTKLKLLEEEKKKYLLIQSALDGVKFDAKEDMKNFPVDAKSVRSLLEIKHMLQNQLDSSRRICEGNQNENKRVTSKLMSYGTKVKRLEQEKLELESVITTLRQKVESLNCATPSPGPSSSTAARSRDTSALSLKSRKATQKKKKLDATILISSDEDEVDEDIGVLKPFTFKLPEPSQRKRAFPPAETATKQTSKSTLRRSESQPSLTSAKLVSKATVVEKNPCTSFLNGRSNVPGVSPISPFVQGTEARGSMKTKKK